MNSKGFHVHSIQSIMAGNSSLFQFSLMSYEIVIDKKHTSFPSYLEQLVQFSDDLFGSFCPAPDVRTMQLYHKTHNHKDILVSIVFRL